MIRTDRIGDVVLTLPLVDVLKLNYPDALIDFLVNKRVAELIENYPNINKVHSIEKDSIKSIRTICKDNNYNLAIIVHPSFKIAMAVFLSNIQNRLGTAYRWYSFLFNLRHHQHRKYAEKHELEYNLDLLKEINCNITGVIKLSLPISSETFASLESKIADKNFNINVPFIVIHPGMSGSAKQWGKHNFIKLLQLLDDERTLSINIVLTGSKNEEELLNEISMSKAFNKKLQIFTNLNLKELAALLSKAKMFVSNSTGPIHIAAAAGTFVIGFYPVKKVESVTRWGPVTEKRMIFKSDFENESSEFLDNIQPAEVFNFIKSYFRE